MEDMHVRSNGWPLRVMMDVGTMRRKHTHQAHLLALIISSGPNSGEFGEKEKS